MSKNKKFIFFGYGVGYMHRSFQGLTNRKDFLYVELSFLRNLLLKLGISPGWVYADIFTRCDKTPIFVFYEFSPAARNRNFLQWLAAKFPQGKIVYYFTNYIYGEIFETRYQWVIQNKELYNLLLCSYKSNADSFGLAYYPWAYSPKLSQTEEDEIYDISFVGIEKGRLDLVVDVAKKFENEGIKACFHLTGCKNRSDSSLPTSVHLHTNALSYQKAFYLMQQSKCIMEIVPFGLQEPTFRIAEVIAMKKRLLTTNLSLKESSLFNSKQISFFSTSQDIDINWLKESFDKKEFIDIEKVSAKGLLSFLEDNT